MKRRTICFFAALMAGIVHRADAATVIYDPVLYGDVTIGAYTSAVYLSRAWATNGVMTNASVTYTNTYRVTPTNRLGRYPLGTNWVTVHMGSATTNAVVLNWQQAGGASGYVVEKSWDAGSTWTNWAATGPLVTNWTDYGSNTWAAPAAWTSSPIAAPMAPWGGTGDVISLQVQLDSADAHIADVSGRVSHVEAWDTNLWTQSAYRPSIGLWGRDTNGVLRVLDLPLAPAAGLWAVSNDVLVVDGFTAYDVWWINDGTNVIRRSTP